MNLSVLWQTPEENDIIVRIIKAHIGRAPRSFSRSFDDSGTQSQHLFVFLINILHGKCQTNVLVLIIPYRSVIINRQCSSFSKNELMRFITAVVFCFKKLFLKVSEPLYVVCQQTYFIDFHIITLSFSYTSVPHHSRARPSFSRRSC